MWLKIDAIGKISRFFRLVLIGYFADKYKVLSLIEREALGIAILIFIEVFSVFAWGNFAVFLEDLKKI